MSPTYSSRQKPSFYWYDTETTGLRNSYDRIIQFAGQRTDLNLNPLGEPLSTYVRLPPEIVPTAESFQVTKIRPSTLAEQGIPEHELFCNLRQELHTANTCIIGYNNISFDDHFVRFGMYRNLLPPYEHEHKRGNCRLDFLSIVRLTGALRPDGLIWPTVDGVPSFALGNLAKANGITTAHAHDALADVNMTIELAQKVKSAQPKLWKYAFNLRNQDIARKLLNPASKQAVLHVSSKYGNARYCLAPVLPITQHPDIPNRVIVVDLESNVDLLVSRSSEELARILFDRKETDEDCEPEERLNVVAIALNQAPMVAILRTLLPENIKRLKIDPTKVESNARRLRETRNVAQKLRGIFGEREEEDKLQIAEEALYDGFISDIDRRKSAQFWEDLNNGKSWVNARFEDRRLQELHSRLKVKISPQELTQTDSENYAQFVRQQLVRSDRNLFAEQESIANLLKQELPAAEAGVLQELQDHLRQLATQFGVESTN